MSTTRGDEMGKTRRAAIGLPFTAMVVMAMTGGAGNPPGLRCAQGIPRVQVRHVKISPAHACTLALAGIAVALIEGKASFPSVLQLADITEVIVSQLDRVSSQGAVLASYWIVDLSTRKENYDVEVQFSRAAPEILVTPTHKFLSSQVRPNE